MVSWGPGFQAAVVEGNAGAPVTASAAAAYDALYQCILLAHDVSGRTEYMYATMMSTKMLYFTSSPRVEPELAS